MFFADNFRECATLNAFHEEIFKLHFLLNLGRSIFFMFKRKSFLTEDNMTYILCFVNSWVSYSSSSCHATRSQTVFSKELELAIAKTAKYI